MHRLINFMMFLTLELELESGQLTLVIDDYPNTATQLMFYLAEKHPEADVLGIDISPIQPEK